MGPHNIWWQHYRLFSDYMKRISYLMTDVVSHARVAVLCDNNRVPSEKIAELYEHQIDFHYLPVAMLKDCAVREHRLCIGTCEFDVIVDLYSYRTQEAYSAYLTDVRVVNEAAELTAERDDSLVQEKVDYRIVVTESDCPCLRAVYMEKEGVSWYLFSNEGEDTIEMNVFVKELQTGRKPFLVDLWDCCAENIACLAGKELLRKDGSCIRLKLEHCEMKLLLILDDDTEHIMEQYRSNSISSKAVEGAFLGDWTKQFEQYDSDAEQCANTVVYRRTYLVPKGGTFTGAEYFMVRGEEMAECVCNGTFAGVSFYGPHTFRIGHLLIEGENEISLRFTGNAVNLYGDVKVPYGLE